ncbi:MAG: hypothetical protein M3473_02520 [Chloroflexota bacterium]|nr:hypothetical protein [Chloroflexota bacterium]
MQPADSPVSSTAVPGVDGIDAAFRGVHGRRLHGFALLLTLGDRPVAARLAARALTAAAPRVDELRHPERAASWLRAQVLRHAPRARRASRPGPAAIRALGDLGADASVVTALGILSRRERAALIATDVERLDQRDVGTIIGADGADLGQMIKRARSRYAQAFAASSNQKPFVSGPLTAKILAARDRALR